MLHYSATLSNRVMQFFLPNCSQIDCYHGKKGRVWML